MSKVMEDFGSSGFVVNCETREEAIIFINICYIYDITWGSWEFDDDEIGTHYDDYYEYTCYRGEYGDINYWSVDDYIEWDYKVITFKEFMKIYDGINLIKFPNIY